MGEKNTKSKNLTSYIREVESKERARKRVIMISVGGIMTIAAVGLVSFLVKSPGSARKVAYDDLSIDRVSEMFEVDNTELIVEYPNQLSPDTIRSMDDYLSILVSEDRSKFNFEQVSRFEPAEEFVSDPENSETPAEAPENEVASMNQFRFAIEGDRKAGEEMMFAIQDFDKSIKYRMDFGNGVTKKIGQFVRYTYPLPGKFLVNLIAENEHKATSTYSRFIEVADDKEEILLASADTESALPLLENEGATSSEEGVSADSEAVAVATPLPVEVPESTEPASAAAEIILEESEPEPEAITGPLIFADKMPEFKGGRNALGSFLRKKIRYPQEAIDNKIEGRVYLRFVVEADGSISNPIIVRGIGYGCDQEAIRLAKLMPNWVPGEQKGRKVPVYAEFLVNFKFLNR